MPVVLLINAAYVLLLGAAFTRSIRHIRVLLIAGAFFFVAFGAATGIWSMVAWNFVIGGVHTTRLLRDVRASRAIALTPQECAVRDDFLPDCSDFDFYTLWSMGSRAEYDSNMIVQTGSLPTTVSMIMEGTVELHRNGVLDRGLRRGALIGEMSFVSGDPASVDVRAKGKVVVHQWDQRQLSALGQTHPPSARALNQLISKGLAAKVRA